MLQIIATSYLLFYILVVLVSANRRVSVSRKWYLLTGLAVLSIAVWAYSLEPHKKLDLYRLQLYVEQIQYMDASFIECIITGIGNYKGLVSFNALCYVVGLLGNLRLLSFFSVLLTLTPILFIILDYIRTEKYDSRAYLMAVLITFMGMQLQYVFSGVRNGISVSFAVTAVYLKYRKKCKGIWPYLIYFISFTMHPISFVLLPVIIVSRFRYQRVLRGVALFSLPMVFGIGRILAKLPLQLLNIVGERLSFYSTSAYIYDRPELIADISVFIVFSFSYWLMKKGGAFEKEASGFQRYLNSYYFLGFMMLGCSLHRDIALRIGYFMGISAIPIMCKTIFDEHNSLYPKRQFRQIRRIMVALILVCCAKVYYDTVFVMMQWNWSFI